MNQDASQTSGTIEHLSRRERRELMRSQKQSGIPGGSGFLRRALIWGGTIGIIFLVGWGMVKLSKSSAVSISDGTLSAPVTAQDNAIGRTDAKVSLVEYSDFQCPACAAFVAVIDKALAEPELKDKVHFVYRYFPLSIHTNAQLASQAVQAAALQGKFWEMHDVLFEQQSTWSALSGTAVRTAFLGYAKQIGLDVSRYSTDIDSSAVKDRVEVIAVAV